MRLGLVNPFFRKRLHDKTSRNTAAPNPWTRSAPGRPGSGHIEDVLIHEIHLSRFLSLWTLILTPVRKVCQEKIAKSINV